MRKREKEAQLKTSLLMYGNWVNIENEILITISRDYNHHCDEIIIIINDSRQIILGHNAHWSDDNLMHLPYGYYIKYADQKHLVFGKNIESLPTSDNEWEYLFNRQ